jgi:hypothetical protein
LIMDIVPADFFNIINWAMSAYDGLGEYKYPLIIVGILGYAYMATKSITLFVVAIIVTFAIFAPVSLFADVPDLSMMFSLISVIGIVSLLMAVLLKKEGVISGSVKE